MKNSYLKCPLCGSTLSKPIGADLTGCAECGFAWIDNTKTRLKPAPSVESNEAVWRSSKTGLFKFGLRVLEKLRPQKGELLDIGTGFGYFLDMAKTKGWKVSGIEIEPKALSYARNVYKLRVYDKPAQELNLEENKYDAVTLWSVIEQFTDPVAEIKNAYRILKPGGVIFIRSYNFSFHRILMNLTSHFRFMPLGISPGIIHTYNFTAKNLERILACAGFIKAKTINSPATWGDPYSTGGLAGRYFVIIVKLTVYLFSQLLALLTFNKLLLSSSLIATARKPENRD